MKATRIAVTGATGQVGAALVRRLRDEGWHVVATTRNALGAALVHASAPDADIRVGSLGRVEGKHLVDDCDVIVNCALAGADGNPRQAYTHNRALVDGLLGARSLRWLIHFSTVAVYGELIRGYRDERRAFDHPEPTSEYGRSKLYVERYVARQGEARGIRATLLRLGHVYGAGIGRSREIIELARHPDFELPFGGRFPSNGIHIDRLSESMVRLLHGNGTGGTFSFAEKDSSWRDVFDWHTSCLGLPAVSGMSEEDSEAAREVWARASIAHDVASWVRALPVKQLVRAPAVFDLGLRILAHTPSAITTRVTKINQLVGASSDVVGTTRAGGDPLPPPYLSAGMPGPYLDLAPVPREGAGSDAVRCQELREWFQLWSTPGFAAPRRMNTRPHVASDARPTVGGRPVGAV
jgi:nucleoside-diphosphate-sugar epimerase